MTAEMNGRLLHPYLELKAMHEAEDSTDWIWDQLIAPGYLTRVDGRPKVAGKSTLLFALCQAIRTGEPFLGLNTRVTTIAYCSEQRWRALNAKLIQPYGAPPYMHLYHDEPLTLATLVPRLLDEALDLGVELVILDTVGKWMRLPAGGRNDSDLMAAQMTLLEQLSERLAVVVCDYTRKGESAAGEGTIGSTEQTGRADILIEIKRPDEAHPNVRRLEITGRSDAPATIDYTFDENHTLVPADLDELRENAANQTVLEALRADPKGVSGSALAHRLKKRKQSVLDELNELLDQGAVYTIGTGSAQVWAPVPRGSGNRAEPNWASEPEPSEPTFEDADAWSF